MGKFKLPSSRALAISRSGRWCAASGRKIFLGDLHARDRGNSAFLLQNTSHLAFSPSEDLLITKNSSGELILVEVPSLKIVAMRRGVYEEGSEITFSACGDYLIDGSWRGRLALSSVKDLKIERAWNYDGEMLGSVSLNETRSLCLVAHQPKSNRGPAYLNIWEWPLDRVPRRIDPRLDILYAATLSPGGSHIAAYGYCRSEGRTVLRLITSEGVIIATRQSDLSGHRLRWLTSDTVVMVIYSGYRFYSCPELRDAGNLEIESAADILILRDESEILIGTTKEGYLLNWSNRA